MRPDELLEVQKRPEDDSCRTTTPRTKMLTPITAFLLSTLTVTLFCLMVAAWRSRRCGKDEEEPPSPPGLPFVGHLHLLGGYEVPYQAFTDLGKKYGDLVGLRLGSVRSLVVNGQRNIREVLVTKGHLFDSRPNFERYQRLFCGDKNNSLAFCDWSDKQKARRDMLRAYTFPRAFTHKYNALERILLDNTNDLVHKIDSSGFDTAVNIKPLILRACANIFTNHFCSKEFEDTDASFTKMVSDFDEIFYEVNQGYAADFLPVLLPLHYKNLKRMNKLTHSIRNFILEEIIGGRFEEYEGREPVDYVESLIDHVKSEREPRMTWDTALFALEDIIGGHSAVGNYIVKVLSYLVNEPEVQRKMQSEIDSCSWIGNGHRAVTIGDRNNMPYTDAVLFEAIRLIASPIVPRVANQDTYVNGYKIKKDTLIFLNNYDLSMSEDLWEEPNSFKPERFLHNGRVVKPEHFLPFGGGRRSCMGYKMVQLTSFGVISSILQNYDVVPVDGESYKVPVGLLALPTDTFKFRFVRRT